MPNAVAASASAPHVERARRSRARIQTVAKLLDGAFRVPGTRIRFGLDAVFGLIPGIGDVVGLLLGAAILYEGVRIGAPRGLLVKMLGNSLTDALGGLLPVIGDVFDVAFRSNLRNASLLIEHLDQLAATSAPAPTRTAARLGAFLLVTLFVLAALGLLAWIWTRLLS